jgi:LuxR family transcriptional regulator, maltose regulon positive regulatory protein
MYSRGAMSDRLLLKAKLFPPRPERGELERAVLDTARRCVDYQLTLITGGAGMGKTHLAAELIRAFPRSAWISLDEAECDLPDFMGYIASALAPFCDAASLPSFDRDFSPSEFERISVAIDNSLAGGDDLFLVLDDAQEIWGSAASAFLFAWIRRAPPNLHFIITARNAPDGYLGDLAFHGKLLAISHDDLKLSDEEARSLLSSPAIPGLDAEGEADLVREADGWIGGLRLLAALAENGRRGASGAAGQPPAPDRKLLWQFLATEIFAAQGEADRDLLVLAAVLPSCEEDILAAALSDAGAPERIDALAQKIPFLGRLEGEGTTRRIHPLFRDFLGRQYAAEPARFAAALAAAQDFCESKGELAAALDIAALRGDDASRLRILKSLSYSPVFARHLLDLPAELALSDGELALTRAFLLYSRYDIDECYAFVSRLRERNANPAIRALAFFLGSILPIDVSEPDRSLILRPQDVPIRTFDDPALGPMTRSFVYFMEATQNVFRYRLERASVLLAKMRCVPGWNTFGLLRYYSLAIEANVFEEGGRLGSCLDVLDELKAILEKDPFIAYQLTSNFIGRVGIYLKRFELDKAAEELKASRRIFNYDCKALYSAYDINLAEYYVCVNDRERGRTTLKPYVFFDRLFYQLDYCLLLLDRLGGADERIKSRYLELCDNVGYETLGPTEAMLYLRFKPDASDTLERLDALLGFFRQEGCGYRLIDALAFKAGLLSHRDRNAALDALREAVHDASIEGLAMPLIVETQLEDELLVTFRRDHAFDRALREAAFLDRLIDLRRRRARGLLSAQRGNIATVADEASSPSARSVVDLSGREREVLDLVAEGKSNAEIATALFIALPTVKSHVSNIYSKLGASRRTEALEKARRLGLLGETGAATTRP